jgi:hypothetical protein
MPAEIARTVRRFGRAARPRSHEGALPHLVIGASRLAVPADTSYRGRGAVRWQAQRPAACGYYLRFRRCPLLTRTLSPRWVRHPLTVPSVNRLTRENAHHAKKHKHCPRLSLLQRRERGERTRHDSEADGLQYNDEGGKGEREKDNAAVGHGGEPHVDLGAKADMARILAHASKQGTVPTELR